MEAWVVGKGHGWHGMDLQGRCGRWGPGSWVGGGYCEKRLRPILTVWLSVAHSYAEKLLLMKFGVGEPF